LSPASEKTLGRKGDYPLVIMEGNGSGRGGTDKRGSKVIAASLISLVLGLVAYAVGFLMYSYSWHRYNYFGLGEDRSSWFKMMEWGNWVEGAGIMLVILGVVLYVVWKRKGV
jgi:hypothetical protein